ncbi:DUF2808 domain-containing protein [Nostoc sp.]|uniref:DUF2808 domain-containing protein n=1 Tax=Nostoc sp. TaxID=1180 RepID=UPI002FF518DD
MKRLIQAAALTLTIASFNSTVYGYSQIKSKNFPYIVGADQFPKTRARVVRDSLRLKIPSDSRALSQLTITVPNGLTVRNEIAISDQSNQKTNAKITVKDKTITIAFPEQIAPGTELKIDLNRVLISGISNSWLFPVSVRLVGLNADIPIGVFRLQLVF